MRTRTSLALAVAALAAAPAIAGGDAAPDTMIDRGPGVDATITQRTPVFTFSSTEPDATFACSVDGGDFEPCASPHEVESLADGRHRFSVQAIGALGDADPTPASRAFDVDATPPDAVFTRTPKKRVITTRARVAVEFAFVSSEPRSHFECARESEPFAYCASPLVWRVGSGWHHIMVRAIDRTGNVDGDPDDFLFRVRRQPVRR